MNTLMTFFGVPLTSFGLMSALAVLVCLMVAGALAMKNKVDYGSVIRFATLAVVLAWFFARLIYVLANCTYYITTLSNPWLSLRFWDGGYAITGAVSGLLLAALITEKWRKLPRGVLLDAAAMGMLCGMVLERISEAGTGMGLGRTILTDWYAALPFVSAVDVTGETVHAVFRYEALTAALIFFGMMIFLLRCKEKTAPGDVLLMVLTILGAVQVLLESLRNDGHMVVHFVRINQVLWMLMPVMALGIWTHRRRRAGQGKGLWLKWLLVVAAIAVGVVQEFRIDASEKLWLDYGIMAACLAVVAVTTLSARGCIKGQKA